MKEEFSELVDAISQVIGYVAKSSETIGQTEQRNACEPSHPDQSVDVWFIDPPYYDSVPYADLSDFFYIWLKRIIPEASLNKRTADSQNGLTPKFSNAFGTKHIPLTVHQSHRVSSNHASRVLSNEAGKFSKTLALVA